MDLKVLSPNEAANYGREYVNTVCSYHDDIDHTQFRNWIVYTSADLDGLPAKRAFIYAAITEFLTLAKKKEAREAEQKRRREEAARVYDELFGDINGG